MSFDIDGRAIDAAEWERRKGEWLPTAEDRANAIWMALSGIADDVELGDLAELLELHPKNDTFPGRYY